MELPFRQRGDQLLKPGELTAIRGRLRAIAGRHDLATVIACAFDHRTRMLPFIYADVRMAPAGPRAIGSALADAGFVKTRIVLQQWNRNFRPSRMQLDGRVPDIFCVSSMQIHTERGKGLIRDACRIPADRRPLILAGGPKFIYEPWEAFSPDPADPWGADVAVTGEEYVFLALLEAILSVRSPGEPMREAFYRAKTLGALDEIPGLVYPLGDAGGGVPEELVDTGIQRLVGDLDETPDPVLGYGLLEAPSLARTLKPKPLAPDRVKRYSKIGALVLTFGCKFGCPYCPIPAYNQRNLRFKSGDRIGDEMTGLYRKYGMRFFFGTDDNFFNDRQRALEISENLARRQIDGRSWRHIMRWGTEVTVHDVLQMKDDLRMVRSAGVRALWMGVEDMTGALVKKGQSVDATQEAFATLIRRGIVPMPMMMHHDSQPLWTRKSHDGLLNQVKLLRKAGAVGLQVLMIGPATGAKMYMDAYESGLMYESVGSKRVRPHMLDGNFVIASRHPKPWRKQLNLIAANLYFFNVVRLFACMFKPGDKFLLARVAYQLLGIWGLALQIARTAGWALRLRFGKIRRTSKAPTSPIPMRSADGAAASHDLRSPEPVEKDDSAEPARTTSA